ncbi:type VII secretion protein EccE [Mycobacteroides abscessus]|uniref:type VII secretion protein EccE n=1 Tax=Mycobacteroides abscessus TaxID=36809 RepID=UPI001EED4E33|nr:type VII secretion protein EccE [Mycobacteroides abscessus]
MNAQSATTTTGFTKPPMFGLRFSTPRIVTVCLASMAWLAATVGRLHPAAIAVVPAVLSVLVFVTIYHVAVTHWTLTWWGWRQSRTKVPSAPPPAVDVFIDDTAIGVVEENEQMATLIELHSDPLAPAVVTDTEERTVNKLAMADLADIVSEVLDVRIDTADFVCNGFRAAGGFAGLYQQMTGPTVGPAQRRSWIILRTRLLNNLAAIDRRGGDAKAARKVAAATCLRVADTLARSGIDARPADAATIDAVNDELRDDPPAADHWSHLESRNSFTGVYHADPDHVDVDSPQWWTWSVSQQVTTLVRLTPSTTDTTRIAALVRYRTSAPTPAPPVSRLGPLYGVQSAMWQQFRVGYLQPVAPIPSAALTSKNPKLPFGPAGPLIGQIGDPLDHSYAHLPLAGPITVLCQSPMLLKQIALRSTTTGRPLVVVTDEPEAWRPIVSMATSGVILDRYPAHWRTSEHEDDDSAADADSATVAATPGSDIDPRAILVIDIEEDWPENLPSVTVLTGDEACDSDVELVDTDDKQGFTLKIRTFQPARVRSAPAHEERRILGVNPPPAPILAGLTPPRPSVQAPRDFSPVSDTGGHLTAEPAAQEPPAAPTTTSHHSLSPSDRVQHRLIGDQQPRLRFESLENRSNTETSPDRSTPTPSNPPQAQPHQSAIPHTPPAASGQKTDWASAVQRMRRTNGRHRAPDTHEHQSSTTEEPTPPRPQPADTQAPTRPDDQ